MTGPTTPDHSETAASFKEQIEQRFDDLIAIIDQAIPESYTGPDPLTAYHRAHAQQFAEILNKLVPFAPGGHNPGCRMWNNQERSGECDCEQGVRRQAKAALCAYIP